MRLRFFFWVIALFLILLAPAYSLVYVTETFALNDTAVKDLYIYEGSADTNYDSSTTLSVGQGGDGALRTIINVSFIIDTIEPGSNLNLFNITFYAHVNCYSTNWDAVNAYPIKRTWGETQTTWANFNSGGSSPDDYDSSWNLVVSRTPATFSGVGYVSFIINNTWVESVLNGTTSYDQGIIFIADSLEGGSEASCYARTVEYATKNQRWSVYYNYTNSTIVPPIGEPSVVISSPTDGDNVDSDVNILGSVFVSNGVVNDTWINNTLFTNKGTNASFNFTPDSSLDDGETYYLMVLANNSEDVVRNSTVYFTADLSGPNSTSDLHNNHSLFYSYENMVFQINITDNTGLDSVSITTPEGFSFTKTSMSTQKYIYNGSIDISDYGIGQHNITAKYCDDLNCNNATWEYYIFNYSVEYDSIATTDEKQTFSLLISFDDIILNSTSMITYNGTTYNATTVISENNISHTVNITPTENVNITSNVNFNWNFTLNVSSFTTGNYTQIVSSLRLILCGNLTNTSAINFTLYDESNNSIMDGDISGTFTYGGTSSYDVELENKNNFSMCIYPPWASTIGSYTLTYSNEGYQERTITIENINFSNSTQLKNLYLLKYESGIFATFKVLDSFSNPISGVTTTLKTTESEIIESRTTDDGGIVTLYVDPDTTYLFQFSKSGYTTVQYSLRVTTTDIITITLEEPGDVQEVSIYSGINYFFRPNNQVLNNNTDYTFIFNLTSSYWEITDCTLYLRNTTTILAQSSSSFTASDCVISITLNTGNQTKISSVATYEINGTETITVRREYTVSYTYQGEYSLKVFLDDIKNFSEAGFDDFARFILAIIIIAGIVFWATKESSEIRNEEEITIALALILIFLFSYIGWLTVPYEPLPNIRGLPEDWLDQWITFILCLLAGGSYILKKVF